ncbi:MAG TPA: hypothetical protein VFE25_13430 [Opitutaceae bacterium]|jgi:hypothetical protein|nr:hypothetical protein [Opitutaceae bacterium]
MTTSPGKGSAAAVGVSADLLQSELSALYALSQSSPFVFASPLGPVPTGAVASYLPRFVFFGPHASEQSWSISLLAGFDHGDLRSSRALVALAARLAASSDTGHALNISIFPVVDVLGLVCGLGERELSRAQWGSGAQPEIALLERDARQRGYHGFVTLETAPPGDDSISIRVCGSFSRVLTPGLELMSTEDAGTFPVRFEADGPQAASEGPLSIADDLPILPFELTIRIPSSWSSEDYQNSAVTLLERFLCRYRAFQAFGQHL